MGKMPWKSAMLLLMRSGKIARNQIWPVDFEFKKVVNRLVILLPLNVTLKRQYRHILNHSQMIRADQIPKIKKFGLSCSIQPQFVESDAPWVIYFLGLGQ